jgi:CDP-glucose 4,6-dehydratase
MTSRMIPNAQDGAEPTATSARQTTFSRFWRDRPVFVTGGTGLVGAWLVRRLLEAGADVVCLVRDWVPQSELVRTHLVDRVNVVRGDICDQVLLERVLGEYEVETVIHLAAQTIVGIANRNPVSTFTSNIQGTWALLEACRRSPAVRQIVVASSDKAYGDQPKLPYDETTPLQGEHPYDVSKSCADLIAHAYAKSYGLPVCVTRCGNFYGGGDLNWNRIVPGTIRSIARGERPIIRSDGSFIRDYFYVEDGAAAYMLLAERMATEPHLAGEAFNFSNELQVTVLELVRRILDLMDSTLAPDVRDEANNEIVHQYLSAAKARRTLHWSPLFTLDEGLRRTIAWYQEFLAGGVDSATNAVHAESNGLVATTARVQAAAE